MSSLNRVTLMGRVGKDPEMRRTQAGTAIGTFSIATSESWKDRATGEKKEKTEWHNIVVWGNNDGGGLTNVVEKYVHKGDLLFVEGQMATEKYTDKEGVERFSTKVVLKGPQAVLKLMPRSATGGAAEGAIPPSAGETAKAPGPMTRLGPSADPMDDDIPFG